MKTFTPHKKSLLLSAALLLFVGSSFAQGGQEVSDTTHIKLGDSRLEVINYHPQYDNDSTAKGNKGKNGYDSDDLSYWKGLSIGVSGLLTPDNKITNGGALKSWELDYSKSINFNLNFAGIKANIIKDYLGVMTGAGLEFNQYAFKNNIYMSVSSETTMAVIDSFTSYSKNKLRATYLVIPAMIEINTSKNPNRSFHITTGVTAGWKIGSSWKYRFETDEEEVKNKVKSHYNINPFKFAAHARVGFGNYTLYGTYALNSLFEKGKGPELYPFSVGIAFTGM